jgi:hypothetical protein
MAASIPSIEVPLINPIAVIGAVAAMDRLSKLDRRVRHSTEDIRAGYRCDMSLPRRMLPL